MPLLNRYHGCVIESSDDGQRHTLRRDGKAAEVFDSLAEAIRAARRTEERVDPADEAGDTAIRPPRFENISETELDPELPATD